MGDTPKDHTSAPDRSGSTTAMDPPFEPDVDLIGYLELPQRATLVDKSSKKARGPFGRWIRRS